MLGVFISRCLHGTQRSLPQLLLTSIVTLHIILTATTRALGGRGEGRGRDECGHMRKERKGRSKGGGRGEVVHGECGHVRKRGGGAR